MLGSEKHEYGGQAPENMRENVEILTAAKTLSEKDTGKTFFLNSATEFAVTLPAPKLGLKFKFFVKAAPSGADYTIVTKGAAQNLGGRVVISGSAAASGDTENAATATTISFVGGQAVYGDYADVVSDGDGWYALCVAAVAAGVTITG